jgi:hypothetical protein
VHRDQQVGDDLHPHAVAELPDVVPAAGHGRQHRGGGGLGLVAAAHVGHDVAPLGLRPGAAERAVEQGNPVAGQEVPRDLLLLDGERAGFDDRAPGRRAGGESPVTAQHFPQRLRGGQRGDHDVGVDPGRARGRAAPSLRVFLHAHRIDVVSGDRVPGSDEVAAQRRSHRAKPDKPNRSGNHVAP